MRGRALFIGMLLIAMTGQAQTDALDGRAGGVPEQPHVALWEKGLMIHFAIANVPLNPGEQPLVEVTMDGETVTHAAEHTGTVRGGSIVETTETHVYSVAIEVEPGQRLSYRYGTLSRGLNGPHEVSMPGDGPIRIAAYGDIGYEGVGLDGLDDGSITGGSPPILVRDLTIAQEPDVFLALGDLAYHPGKLMGYDRFMRMMAPLQATVPTMTTIGNHEWHDEMDLGYSQFLNEWVLPANEMDFVFKAGDVTFVTANSDGVCRGDTYRTSYGHRADPCPDGDPDLERIAWLDKVLAEAAADETTWTIVFFHHPTYSWGRHSSDVGQRLLWEPLFIQHGVDLVLTGHDHLYSRTYPVMHEKTQMKGDTYPQGVAPVYVVQGGGGRPLYDLREPDADPPDWYASGGKVYGTTIVDATSESLTVTSIGLDGVAYDRFVIDATMPAPEPVDDGDVVMPTAVGGLVLLILAGMARRRAAM